MISVKLNNYMGSDLTTVNAARVSFNKKATKIEDRDIKLIEYLGKHDHISPFGHSFFSFTVEAPVFVARQLVKHKFLRWNEVSRRYVDDDPLMYVPKEWRVKAKDKKQGSGGPLLDAQDINDRYGAIMDDLQDLYLDMVDEDGYNVAPEMARMILPQAMMTSWWWSGSLDAFASMCNLRCKPDTQEETRRIADRIDHIIAPLFPHSWKALRK